MVSGNDAHALDPGLGAQGTRCKQNAQWPPRLEALAQHLKECPEPQWGRGINVGRQHQLSKSTDLLTMSACLQ